MSSIHLFDSACPPCLQAKVIVLDAHDGEDDENDDAFWALLGGKVEAVPDPVPEAHLNAEVHAHMRRREVPHC